MNKRIQELAEQARRHYLTLPTGYKPEQVGMYKELMEKFAELIVGECVKVMYDNAIERKVPPDINQTPTPYAIAVLEHFGVEE